MQIGEFDVTEREVARSLLRGCADVPAWCEALLDARPYGDAEALYAAAARLASAWSGAEVDRALADHPRIGERHAGEGDSARHSAGEQAGVDTGGDVAARLAAGNAAYEERFGRIFLVRAAGRDAEEILGLLEQRLRHDDETETAVTAQQLGEIALLRLRAQVQQSAAS